MLFLLDTNVCVALLRGRQRVVADELLQHAPSDIALCAVVKAELWYGASRSADPARSFAQLAQFVAPYVSLPFDDPSAQIAGSIRAHLAAQGTPIGSNDLHIAAIALANNLTLVTHNTSEFRRVPGLHLDDWETTP